MNDKVQVCFSLSDFYFTKHNTLYVYPCCWKWHYFILLNCWVIFHYMYIHTHTHTQTHTLIFIHSSVHEHLDCFHTLVFVSNAAMNIGVHASFQISVCFSSLASFSWFLFPSFSVSLFSFLFCCFQWWLGNFSGHYTAFPGAYPSYSSLGFSALLYQERKAMTMKVGAGECVSGWKSVKKKGLFGMWRGGWRCTSRDHLMIEKWVWSSQSDASNFTEMKSLYSQWHSQAVVLSSSWGRINCFFIFDAFAFMYSCVGALSPWNRIGCLGSASSLTQLSMYTFAHNTHTHTHTHTHIHTLLWGLCSSLFFLTWCLEHNKTSVNVCCMNKWLNESCST